MKADKLNYPRTVLVGLAFLSICAFWQLYDNIVPLILTGTFRMNETLSGAIMAADNVLALVLLPLFGALSDRTQTRLGRRMPYILGGTAAAVLLMNLLPALDNAYAIAPGAGKTAAFVAVLGLLLIAMGAYRSPAVALMPDVTPKPLRSKGNAVINLMGALGGILCLAVAAALYPEGARSAAHADYRPLFLIVSGVMAASVAVMLFTVREPQLSAANRALEQSHPEWNLAEANDSGHEVLPPEVRRSLGFLLSSIALWFIGYNGVTTWFTTYVDVVMGQGLGGASACLLIASGGAVASYLPIGLLASRIGRRKTILGGCALLSLCFLLSFQLTVRYHSVNAAMFIVFACIGFAWAAINVNSLPMVVEMCRGSDVGKFTGYYYAASMAAQVVTPVLAGTLLRHVSYRALFPYAAFFVACSFITMLFVRHGDARIAPKSGLGAFEDMGD